MNKKANFALFMVLFSAISLLVFKEYFQVPSVSEDFKEEVYQQAYFDAIEANGLLASNDEFVRVSKCYAYYQLQPKFKLKSSITKYLSDRADDIGKSIVGDNPVVHVSFLAIAIGELRYVHGLLDGQGFDTTLIRAAEQSDYADEQIEIHRCNDL